MRERLKHKYALSEQGVNDMIKAVIIVTIANLAFMVPVGLLYLLASDILNGGIPSSKLPMYIGGMVISILLILLQHTSSTTQHSSQLMWKVESEDVHWQRN